MVAPPRVGTPRLMRAVSADELGAVLVRSHRVRAGHVGLLKGRELPPRLAQALGFIPPAAFAALVANDLLNPGMFDAGVWPAAIPLVAAVASALVAVKTKSLLWTAVAGVAVYAALAFFAV